MQVFREAPEVTSRLEQLGLTKAILEDVVRAAVGGRRDSSPFDPPGAGGTFAYIFGTRRMRSILVPMGWDLCDTDNIASAFNPKSGIKIIYQSAERAGHPVHDPLAASKRGSGHARAVESGQTELWPEIRQKEISRENAASWYLFVYVVGDDVRAELSRPIAVDADQFKGFHERILIVQKGDWASIPVEDDLPDLPDFEVPVTRKE